MRQTIQSEHLTTLEGLPAGGRTTATGISIDWQSGPLRAAGGEPQAPNGAFVEGVIQAALDRIHHYQTVNGGKFACRQNALAITKLEEALHWLDDRTAERTARGVEGTHTP